MSITTPALTVERASGSTGARIRGVDLNALDDDTFATIRQALLEHGVVHLPGQDVTPKAHEAFRHSWTAGDVVLWDNRGVMHFAVHDYEDQHRVMHCVTVAGDEPR